jgi:hypothetical protein
MQLEVERILLRRPQLQFDPRPVMRARVGSSSVALPVAPRRAMFATAIVWVLVASAPASGQEPLPLGESRGVKAERVRGQITLTFTKRADRLYRRVAGRLVIVTCTNAPPDRGIRGPELTTGGDTTVRIPSKRRKVRTGEASRPLDYCRISLPRRKVTRRGQRITLPRRVLVSIPLTQAGAVRLDEESKTASVAGVLLIAQFYAERRKINTWPTPPQLLGYLQRVAPKALGRIVALPAAADTPPAGKIGYWSDGGENAAVVVLSRAGRRLFLEIGADDVLRTNLAQYLFCEEPQ